MSELLDSPPPPVPGNTPAASGMRAALVMTLALMAVAAAGWLRPALFETRVGRWLPYVTTGLALVWVVVLMVRSSFLPRAARIGGSVLALYGLSALALAGRAGTPFGELLHGGGLGRPLPFWLQGAFIGTFLVLPIAVLAHVARAGVSRWRGTRNGPWHELHRALAVVLCVAIAVATWPATSAPAGSGTAAIAAATASPGSPAAQSLAADVPTDGPPDPLEIAERVDALGARVPPIDWDVDVRADTLGPGVEPSFTFVRDAIRYEAYAGALRGPSGTYTARAGNSIDRALLLAHLLERKHVATQFAIGTLTAADGERLWQRIFETSVVWPAHGQPAAPASGGPTLHQRIRERAERDYQTVRTALGTRLTPVTQPTRDQVVVEMNPHVWVQAQVDGRWVDLDPSFPDATPGKGFAAMERTASELPADLYQRVGIRLVLEHLVNGALVPSTVLDINGNAVDLVDRQMFVVHTPGKPMLMANLGASMGGYNTWTPGLWTNGEFRFGKTFTIDEQATPASARVDPSAADAPKTSGGGVMDAIGALRPEPSPGAPPEVAASTEPVFVAEWLEIELSWPGGRHEVTRRAIADRGSAAWRATAPLAASTLTLLERDDKGPLALQSLHNVWFSAGPHNLADFSEALQDMTTEALRTTSDAGIDPAAQAKADPPEFDDVAWPLALQNFSWMIWTDHKIIPSLNDTPGIRLYADGPRIAIFTRRPGAGHMVEAISDLRRDNLRGVVADPTQSLLLAEKKVRFGMLEGALEQEAMGALAAAYGGDPAAAVSTSSRLGASGVVLLAPGTSWPDPVKRAHRESVARLTASIGAGHTIVAPVDALDEHGAWWEISPDTGDTYSVGDLELHRARVPYNPNYEIPYKGKSVQQNPYGGNQKPYESPAAQAERRAAGRKAAYDSRRAAQERKAAENAAKRRTNDLNKSAKKRGGTEYTVLVVLIMMAGAAASIATGVATAYCTYVAVEALVSD